ncbi:MAG: adenylyl-sulfate kinase [Promethearchaeia archaeon]
MDSKNFAVWLTGIPGSGKSSIAEKLDRLLKKEDISAFILQTDYMRKYITPNPQYNDQERQIVYNAFAFTSKLLVDHGTNVIMDGTGNRRKYRALANEIIPNFLLIFLQCPLKVAIKREMSRADTKEAPDEIYEKAKKGESKTVPGIQVKYEDPKDPDLIVNTDKLNIEESAHKIKSKIVSEFFPNIN